jgi:predicted N-formylglutamate amidohydrolase
VPLYGATVSRLLIDLNRSPGHPRLFSPRVARLDSDEKRRIVERYYLPHRNRVEEQIRYRIENGETVFHLAVHSFVPRLNGAARRTDIGLLYDPARRGERRLCERWKEALREEAPVLCVRRNDPYRGTADGLTTFLRRRFAARHYCGVEIEVNQKHFTATGADRRKMERTIGDSLARLLGSAD